MVHFGNEWDEIMAGEFDLPYYKQLREFLKQEYFTKEIYPDMNNIFNAMKHASYSDIKAVILGQDPYHEPGQAHGLCFSVREDGVLYFRMLGQCSNCPSAVVTAEELVAPPILEAIPELRQVVLDTTVSDELWQDAMELLRRRHNGET